MKPVFHHNSMKGSRVLRQLLAGSALVSALACAQTAAAQEAAVLAAAQDAKIAAQAADLAGQGAAGKGASAEALKCRADGKTYDGDCRHANAGTVVNRVLPENVSHAPAPPLGDLGFSISLEGVEIGTGMPRTIAGAPARPDPNREADRKLAAIGIDLSYDALGARPRLAIATADLRQAFAAGETVTFRASSNYGLWIARAEVVVADKRGKTLAVLPVAPNGSVNWVVPEDAPAEMLYLLRALDAEGRRDETRPLALTRASGPMKPELTGAVVAAAEGEDMTARRGIPVRGAAITVSGQAPRGQSVSVLGEVVPVDASGRFVAQRILPPGTHLVPINVAGQQISRSVTIKSSDWFATGIADLTLGRREGETWRRGRVAGFAQGTLADGTRITASVDTREEELRDLFRDFGRKHPDQTLRSMKSQDIFNTFGDDSVASELAPTSGKLYLRAERDGSHLTWGDFKASDAPERMVRSDRTLYGLSGEYRSLDVTAEGESRLRVTGFAAQADSLMQRDVLRATGGTAYYLSRQDILADSETLMVEVRSRASGLVVETRRLSEGSDYRINPVQGVVFLNAPLASSLTGSGLISDNPLGDYDVNLVAQYEYAPTSGDVDGYSAGVRAENWLNDHLRFGASALRETTGLADNTLLGADVLLKDGETRELSLEYATSEGPGFGSNFSLNGGLDLEPGNPSYGLPGQNAAAWRVAGKSDLEMLGLTGEIAGFFDHKDKGFSSPDDEIRYDQDAWGLAGKVALSERTDLTFGAEALRREDGRRDQTARLGLGHQLSERWTLGAEVAHDSERAGGEASSRADENGARTDIGAKLTWERDEDLSLWAFGQTTLQRDAGRTRNDRAGVGAKLRLSERAEMLAEISGGNAGTAGRLEFGYRPNADTVTTIGYRLDPMRRLDRADFAGQDRGTLVFGTTSRVNDRWSYTTESSYSAFGTRPSLTSGYGVSYTPDQVWRYDGLFQYGESKAEDGSRLERHGVSLGMRYSEADTLKGGLRGEYRTEASDRPESALDRKTWLVAGDIEAKTSEDWRIVASLDAVVSDSDQSAFRDGRYVEARFGYAWRPVENDAVNALFSYTYLFDLPGADQVNIDGDIAGPRQRSHILNAAMNWQVSPTWTLGAKYGFRLREAAERDSDTFTASEAHLAVLRADYHVVHNWDIMGEVRLLHAPSSKMTETAALLGIFRPFGDHLRLGGGYLWGEVSDDLRKIEPAEKGFFLNLTTQF